MILLLLGLLVVVISLYRAFDATEALLWVREFNRITLGLLLIGFSFLPEWGVLAVVLDSTFILIGMFALRATIQAQGEANE